MAQYIKHGLRLSTLAAAMALAGCGGGGSSDTSAPKPVQCTSVQYVDGGVCKNKATQTITGLTLPALSVGDKAMLNAKASSGLAISYSSKTPDVCTVSGNQVTAVQAGLCTVEASQAGDDKTSAAAAISASTETGCTIPKILSEDKKSCITPANLKIGEFIDSAVQGLSYKTPTYSGITDFKGKFYYIEGEEVSFKISALELGTVVASSRVHVSDLASSPYDKKNNKDVKIAQLLQALDEDKNPDNGILLNDNVRQFFTSEKNIDFLIDNDAFTQLLMEKLAPLNVVVPSQEAVKKHIASNLAYVAQGDCPIPSRNIVGYGGMILTNEKLSCNDKTRFQAYLTYTLPKYDDLIFKEVDPNKIKEISLVASREAAQKSFIANGLNSVVAVIKGVDAANQGKLIEGLARTVEAALKLSLIFDPNQTTEKAASGANAIIESMLNAPKCLTLLSAASIEPEAALACVDTFRATLEIPQGDEHLFTKIKPQLTILVDTLKALKSVTEVGEKGHAAIAAAAASSLNAGIGIIRLTTTESGSVANQMLEEIGTSVITPALNYVSCRPDIAALGAMKLNPIGLAADCVDNVVRLTVENVEVIGRRLYGITSLTTMNVTADRLNIVRYALAEIVSSSSGNEMYEKWGIPLNTPYKQGIDLLVQKIMDKMKQNNGWLYRATSGGLESYVNVLQGGRSVIVENILSELAILESLSGSMINAENNIHFKGVDNKNGIVSANVIFASSNIGGRKICFSQGSDHSNSNPYIIEASNNSSDIEKLEFRYVTSGSYTINCLAYNKQGDFVQSQAFPIFINDDVDYKIDLKPYNIAIKQGDAIHVSLVGETGILPRLVRWSFGDGTAEIIAKPTDSVTHYYYTSGIQHIRASILDAQNNVSTLSWSINVQPSSEQKVILTSFNPKTLRFGQLGEIVLQGINLTEGLQLSCESCVDGVRENLAKSNSRQRVYVYVPRTNDMTKVMNDTLVVKKPDGTVLTQTNIPIMPVFDAVTPSSRETVVNSEITFSLSSPLDYVKSVVWSIGEKIIQTLSGIADVFKYTFSTIGDAVVSAELKDKDGNTVSHAETIVTVKPFACPEGQVEQGGKCVSTNTDPIYEKLEMLTFDGIQDAVQENVLALNKDLGTFTASTMVYFNNIDPDVYGKEWEAIFTKRNNDESFGLMMFMGRSTACAVNECPSNNGKTLRIYLKGLSVEKVDYAWSDIQAKRWYHIAYTYDGVNIKIYVDGVLKVTQPSTGKILGNSDNINLGKNDGIWPYYLDGQLKQLKLYDRALSQAEIVGLSAFSTSEYPTRWYQALMQEQQQNKNLVYTVNSDGDMVCATYDGINCLWGSTFAQIDFKKVYPLVCGSEHMKKQYGTDGYSDPKHWCSITKQRHAQKLDSVLSALSGRFDVPATSEKGVALTSPSSTKPLQCSFTATGLTAENGQQPFASPDGMSGYYVAAATMPTAQILELIAKRGNGVYERIGKNKTLQLKANENFAFVVNDAGYAGNSGQYDVTYTCSEITQPTWITNPANGHKYTAVDCGTWTQCEAQAVALGGHLVSVNDAAENAWLVSTFTPDKNYWIGLTDRDQEGVWKWTSGEAFGYSNWHTGEPNNAGGVESYVHMNLHYNYYNKHITDGTWNDAINDITPAFVNSIPYGTSAWGIFEKP